MNSMYEASAALGKAQSIGGLIVSIIIGLVCFGIAFYLFTNLDKNLKTTKANILKSTCSTLRSNQSNQSNQSVSYLCSLDISYVVDNKEYKGSILTNSSTFYTSGGTIDVSYDMTNPNNVKQKQPSSILIGIILLIVGILCLFGGIFNYYLNSTSKAYAATSGINTVQQKLFGQSLLNPGYNQQSLFKF